jgi:hypothetical protein
MKPKFSKEEALTVIKRARQEQRKRALVKLASAANLVRDLPMEKRAAALGHLWQAIRPQIFPALRRAALPAGIGGGLGALYGGVRGVEPGESRLGSILRHGLGGAALGGATGLGASLASRLGSRQFVPREALRMPVGDRGMLANLVRGLRRHRGQIAPYLTGAGGAAGAGLGLGTWGLLGPGMAPQGAAPRETAETNTQMILQLVRAMQRMQAAQRMRDMPTLG